MSLLMRAQLRSLAPEAAPSVIDHIMATADAVFDKYKLVNLRRIWGFFSVACEETGGLTALEENLSYSAQRAHDVWPARFPTVQAAIRYAHSPRLLAAAVYNGRMGNRLSSDDGWNYRGQGLIQITGADNFKLLQKLTGLPLLETPSLIIGNRMLECAVALFVNYPGILAYCDQGNYHAVWALVGSGRATGTVINLPAHETWLARVKAAIGEIGIASVAQTDQEAPRPSPVDPGKLAGPMAASASAAIGDIEAKLAASTRPRPTDVQPAPIPIDTSFWSNLDRRLIAVEKALGWI